jgi:hypothetical protein
MKRHISALILSTTLVGCEKAPEGTSTTGESPGERRVVSVGVASIEYSYDGKWGLYDIASSARALSSRGSVVAEARVITSPETTPISSLEVEEVIYYPEGSSRVSAKGVIRFDVRGRVISYKSTSGMQTPIFDTWKFGKSF